MASKRIYILTDAAGNRVATVRAVNRIQALGIYAALTFSVRVASPEDMFEVGRANEIILEGGKSDEEE